jgi:hypothetical protein
MAMLIVMAKLTGQRGPMAQSGHLLIDAQRPDAGPRQDRGKQQWLAATFIGVFDFQLANHDLF